MKKELKGKFLDGEQEEMPSKRESVGNTSKLTLKQRLTILSRMDRMGKAKPTPVRLLILLAALLCITWAVNHSFSQTVRNSHFDATPKADSQVQFSFVGDVNMGRYIEKYAEIYSYDELFASSGELWANSDLVFANLECVILDDESKYEKLQKAITLPATVDSLMAIVRSGINALSVANNHAIDYGPEGLACELDQLDRLGVTYAGAGRDIKEAATVKILECCGLKIGFLALNTLPIDSFSLTGARIVTSGYSMLLRNVREAADNTDLMIVYVHWGKENTLSLTDNQQNLAHQLIESGADVVIGSHPHILQTVETYKGGIIFYSLGNYLMDQGNRENRTSAMVQLNLDRETGKGEFILIPIRINNFTPQETFTPYYIREVQRLMTKKLSSSAYYTGEDGRIYIPVQFAVGSKE